MSNECRPRVVERMPLGCGALPLGAIHWENCSIYCGNDLFGTYSFRDKRTVWYDLKDYAWQSLSISI